MTGRSPARFLAPLALVAVVIALFIVVSSGLNGDDKGTGTRNQSSGQPASSPTANGKKDKKSRPTPRRYRVRAGDTPVSIAEKTGVPLDDIMRLNPNLDPQTLAPGQRIRLRQ
jgi:LysM repeat protein